ncbi:TPA: hypothetical protein HA351_01315 [Methanosarcinaceae archaeon]|nr:hypothetical protein [Methanosarcinaceae archaeon]
MLSEREIRGLYNRREGEKKIKAARQVMRMQKASHLAKLSENREHLRAMVVKQNSAADTQIENKILIVAPILARNREKLERRKIVSRGRAVRKGRLILSYSLVPSNYFSDCAAKPQKNKMVPDLLYAEKLKKSTKVTLVPDQDFSDRANFCNKICIGRDVFRQRSNMIEKAKQEESKKSSERPSCLYRRYVACYKVRRNRLF